MHIKQITIQGFKSYKDQTTFEPFSPRNNVIVGRNGSGKSNFFSAIRFVLGDAHTRLGREDRQSLLHEGVGSAVMSAFVEIIFDNSDDRTGTGREETVLRRTIGQKKDEYSLDRKNATKSDVVNILEHAGFSKSNPYYIVPQGRVTALTSMKDHERLNLLKDVAGTISFEEKRAESVKMMSETDTKKVKIDELMQYVRDRLDELDEDKRELQEYRDKDRERRCLQYNMYHREQEEINKKLQELEMQRDTGSEELDHNRERFVKREQLLGRIDKQAQEFRQRMELLKLDQKQYEEERRDLVRQRAKIELDVKASTEGQNAADSAHYQRQQDLQTTQSAIKESEKKLAKLMPGYTKAKSQEDTAQAGLERAESTRQRLSAKQGRSAKFRSKSERDKWLQNEINEAHEALAVRKAVAMSTGEEFQALEQEVQQADAEATQTRERLDNFDNATDGLAAEVQRAKEARDLLADQRKTLWRESNRIDAVMRNIQQEMDKSERFLSQMMDNNTSRGIASVRRIKQQLNLEGVYGTLGELFKVHERFRTAVEVTAGNSLFHYVVDNDDTATQVLDILNREQAGRVTFMPLNRLNPKPTGNMPKATDALDMLEKLEYDPKFEKAMRQVFGRTVICPSLAVAAQYARSHGLDAITLDGDRSDKKGALTGGYHDPRNSRLETMQNLQKIRDEHDKPRTRQSEIQHEVESLDQQITRSMNELNRAQQRQRQSEDSFEPLKAELRSKKGDLQAKRASLEQKRKARSNVDASLRELSEQQSALEAEKASDFKRALSEEEQTQLDHLTSTMPDLRRKALDATTKRSELEGEKSTLEVELEENLRPRLDQLQGQTRESTSSGPSQNIKQLQRELDRLSKKVESAEAELQKAEEALDNIAKEISNLDQSRADHKAQQEDTARAIEKHQKRSEKSLAKRALLTEKAAETSKDIRALGTLPDDAFGTKYARITSEKAIKRIHGLQESLKKYSHVNKKAFEQYDKFTSDQEVLVRRRSELDTSQQAIRDLIQYLDEKKDETLNRTFKQVSKHFATIFERLVPAGRGRLIIQRRADHDKVAEAEESDDDEAERRARGVETYTGIGVSVSFNSKHDEQQRIQQLSGGQKSLCALALVFAIQQSDPMPFYLFDEIDANLDAQYRTAVAQLMKEFSNGSPDGKKKGAQFICTTFRPELVHVAEKCYSVSHNNNLKTSSIGVETKENALNFVEQIVGGH